MTGIKLNNLPPALYLDSDSYLHTRDTSNIDHKIEIKDVLNNSLSIASLTNVSLDDTYKTIYNDSSSNVKKCDVSSISDYLLEDFYDINSLTVASSFASYVNLIIEDSSNNLYYTKRTDIEPITSQFIQQFTHLNEGTLTDTSTFFIRSSSNSYSTTVNDIQKLAGSSYLELDSSLTTSKLIFVSDSNTDARVKAYSNIKCDYRTMLNKQRSVAASSTLKFCDNFTECGGFIFVKEEHYRSQAIFAFGWTSGGAGNLELFHSYGTTWGTTNTTANKYNIYISGSDLYLDNNFASTTTFEMTVMVTRGKPTWV